MQANQARPLPRKKRDKAIREIELMKALAEDPAAAMLALADEAQSDWEEHARPRDTGMIGAITINGD